MHGGGQKNKQTDNRSVMNIYSRANKGESQSGDVQQRQIEADREKEMFECSQTDGRPAHTGSMGGSLLSADPMTLRHATCCT